jgi:hypothetical protein
MACCELFEEVATNGVTLLGRTAAERAVSRMWQRRVEQQICIPLMSAFRWGKVCHYMTQPLVELYGGCMVVLKVS